MRPRTLPALLAALVVLSLAGRASAQSDDAQRLFEQGMKELEAHNYPVACDAFAQSHRIEPKPGKVFTLAACETEWGRLASAVKHYTEYLAIYRSLPPDKQAAQGQRPNEAKRQRDAIEPQIPLLTLILPPSAPAPTRITVDGEPVDPARLSAPLPVDPGDHLIVTQAPTGQRSEARIHLEKAQRATLRLSVPAPQPTAGNHAPAPSPAPEPGDGSAPKDGRSPGATASPSARTIVAFASGGVGLAALIVGGVTGGLAASKASIVADHCGEAVNSTDETACDRVGLDAAADAQGMARASDITLGVGAAGVIVSVILFATAPSARPPTANTTGAAATTRPRLAAFSLSADPTGATFGVRGAF